MSEVWIQVIAGLSGVVSTLAVKYLEHLLSAHRKRVAEAPDPGGGAMARADDA